MEGGNPVLRRRRSMRGALLNLQKVGRNWGLLPIDSKLIAGRECGKLEEQEKAKASCLPSIKKGQLERI